MSRENSESTGQRYGLKRVCQVLAFPHSTIYAQAQREAATVVPLHRARRGPNTLFPTSIFWAPYAPIWNPRLLPAKAIARSGRVCASCRASGCPAPASCT